MFTLKTCKLKVRLIGQSKLPVGVRVNGCLSVSTCQPCDELVTCPGCPLPLPQDAVIGSRK